MFYVGGDYEARKGSGIGQGSILLHPGGHAHRTAARRRRGKRRRPRIRRTCGMVDTFRPLGLGEGAVAGEDPTYAWSWQGGCCSRDPRPSLTTRRFSLLATPAPKGGARPCRAPPVHARSYVGLFMVPASRSPNATLAADTVVDRLDIALTFSGCPDTVAERLRAPPASATSGQAVEAAISGRPRGSRHGVHAHCPGARVRFLCSSMPRDERRGESDRRTCGHRPTGKF